MTVVSLKIDAPRASTSPWPGVLAAVLLGCASQPRAASVAAAPSDATRVTTSAPTCVVADSSAPARDTLYVVGVDPPGADARSTDCERRAAEAGNAPVVVAETPAAGADLRDVLDRGLPDAGRPRPDVVVTRDPDVLAYAESGASYFIVALPWNRTYLLVTADSASIIPSEADRDALARNAVTGDVRGAAQPFAWLADAGCAAPFAPSLATPRPVVAYPAGDAIARQLAERIVALAGVSARPAWIPASLARRATAPRIAPVATDSITDALMTGRAAAAVVALPRDPRTRCGTANEPLPWRGAPLVDSRAHVIVRRGSGAAFTIGADGTLHFTRRGPP
jgi:hypothetical protein